MSLSTRAQEAGKPSDKYLIWKIVKDLWDPETNPTGYLSLGVAENTLLHDSLLQHIRQHFDPSPHALTYGDGTTGSNRLKRALATFLTKKLSAVKEILPEHVTVTNGCSASVEHLSWTLANPGEGILLGQPYFRGFIPSIELRTGVKVVPVAFKEVDPFGVEAVQKYEDALLKSRDAGRPVAALMLCNPHNPTGRCYTRDALVGLMKLCEKYKIHLISDELYALSLWRNTIDTDAATPPAPFISCLSIDPTGIIDPSRLHLIWGISKDFGANGLRIGAVISQSNPTLHAALVPLALYSSSSSAADHITANIVEDTPWIDNFIESNSRALSESYSFVATWAKEKNIPYAPGANAAFFLWIKLGQVYSERHAHLGLDSQTAEKQLDALFLKHKVFVAAGGQFDAEEAGWFRLTFAYPEVWLREGLKRIELALDDGA